MPSQGQHVLYQVSTASALVAGVYQGAVRVATLRQNGGLGVGTLESLDGQMVIVDGHFFQVRSDGSVREVEDDVLSPFAAVTAFSPDQSIVVGNCPDLSYLTRDFDALAAVLGQFLFCLESRRNIRIPPCRSDVPDERRSPTGPSSGRAAGV